MKNRPMAAADHMGKAAEFNWDLLQYTGLDGVHCKRIIFVPVRTAMSILGRFARVTVVGFSTIAACGSLALGQSNKSQVVMLPNPTPRQLDLEQKYSKVPVSGTAADHAAILLNQQRHALVTRAAYQLASLAAALNNGISQHKKGTSLAPEVQVADLIEALAKNVNAAVKVDNQPAPSGRPSTSTALRTKPEAAPAAHPPSDDAEAQLRQQAEQLVSVVQELQLEVSKTDQDTLSLSLVAKSAEVERAAKGIKERMKKRING